MNATHCTRYTDLEAAVEQRRAARNAVMRDYQSPFLPPAEARLDPDMLDANLRAKAAISSVTQTQIVRCQSRG